MSGVLTVQTKKYGAITAFDLLHEGRLIASLIKEESNLVDYSRKRIFEDLDTAIEFYLMPLVANRDCWILTIGTLPLRVTLLPIIAVGLFPCHRSWNDLLSWRDEERYSVTLWPLLCQSAGAQAAKSSEERSKEMTSEPRILHRTRFY